MIEFNFDGEVIAEDGIYKGVDMDTYHSDCCAAPSISSSGLRQLAPPDGCPMKFWDDSYLNPNRAPQKDKSHFSLGRAVHTLLLSEEGFKDEYVFRPEEFDSWRTIASKAWKIDQIAKGKTVLENENLEQIEGMANAVANNQHVIDLLRGKVERSIIWKDPATGFYLKARPDNLPADTYIADLKTTADASDKGTQTSVLKFGYHQQLALAAAGLEHLGDKQITDCVLIFIETKRPHAYSIRPIDNQLIHYGMAQNRAAMKVFAEGMKDNYWPTYYGSGLPISTPDWFDKKMENEPKIAAELI